MINSSKTRLSRLNRDFEFSAYGYRFAPHTSTAVPVVQKVPSAIQYALEVPRTQADQLSWARAPGPFPPLPPCLFCSRCATLGQQAATTPTRTEKELEIKKSARTLRLTAKHNLDPALIVGAGHEKGPLEITVTWAAEAALGWQLTRYVFAEAGYRALGLDYDKDGLLLDTITYGCR